MTTNTSQSGVLEARAIQPPPSSTGSILNFSMGTWNEWTSCTQRGNWRQRVARIHPTGVAANSHSPSDLPDQHTRFSLHGLTCDLLARNCSYSPFVSCTIIYKKITPLLLYVAILSTYTEVLSKYHNGVGTVRDGRERCGQVFG